MSWQKLFLIVAILAVAGGSVFAVREAKRSKDAVQSTFADPVLGSSDAKVTIQEYSDFQCPACAAVRPIFEDLLVQYDGKVQLAYNDFPLTSHRNGYTSAVAGQCADVQGQFKVYHDLLFEHQKDWSSLPDPTSYFKDLAKEVGLDEAKFAQCLDKKETDASIQEDLKEGHQKQISGTPTIFINGERFVGATYDVLQQMVAKAVADAYGQDALTAPTNTDAPNGAQVSDPTTPAAQ